MNFLDDRLPGRFWNKLMPCPVTGCWLWIGALNHKGYGSHARRAPHSGSQLTHRFTYEIALGALPPGTEIDHRVCRTRSCANPAHLEAVPHRVNVQRGEAKKTHCKHGHELAGDNLMATRTGVRCRTCANADSRKRKRSKYVRRDRKSRRRLLCKRGHLKHFNGKRLVCRECGNTASRRNRARLRAAESKST